MTEEYERAMRDQDDETREAADAEFQRAFEVWAARTRERLRGGQ